MKKKEKGKTMYQVEKFIPPECPRCRRKFEKENKDYSLLLGDIIHGEKIIRKTKKYEIIICEYCRNYTARILLESYRISDLQTAKKLLKEGFCNFQKVDTLGIMANDSHEIYDKISTLK